MKVEFLGPKATPHCVCPNKPNFFKTIFVMSGVLLDHKIASAILCKKNLGLKVLKEESYKQWWETVTDVNAAFISAEDLKVIL